MYPFSDEIRRAYESMPVPLAYFQREENRIVAVLVSDGMCKMMNTHRQELMKRLNASLLERVHPDDVGRLSRAVSDFSHHLSGYNVVYRVKYPGDAEYRYIHSVGRYQPSPDGNDLAVFVYTDISDNQSETNQLIANYELSQRDRFYTDPVTGMQNLNFMYEFSDEKAASIRNAGETPAIIYFDVNGLRSYNNQYGIPEGDKLLRLAGEVLKCELNGALVTRGTDDHFIALTAFCGEEWLNAKMDSINEKIKNNALGNTTGLQAGVCIFERETTTAEAIDHAQHAHKQIGNDLSITHLYYVHESDDSYWRQRYIIEAFDIALSRHWIKVHYQPILSTQTHRTVALEALARWIDPTRGTISPGEFIPVLTKYHQLYKLDLYMVEAICRESLIRRREGFPMIPVSVNFSAQDFDHADMLGELMRLTEEYGLDHENVIVEITEQDIARGTEHFLKQLQAIRENGFRLWLDDFGSGYSSLNVFSQFDVDLIKFDMNLLRRLDEHNGVNRTIIQSMVSMAQNLGIHTLAEGVEQSEQDRFLGEIGCEFEQGYYFYKPEPLDDHIFKLKRRVNSFSRETPEERESLLLSHFNTEEKYGVLTGSVKQA